MKALMALPLFSFLFSCNRATEKLSLASLYSTENDVRIATLGHVSVLEEDGGEIGNNKVRKYVKMLGEKLIPLVEYQEFNYNFFVTNSKITNAAALPGGYTYFMQGMMLLASNEAEFVNIIGHELGHVNARHNMERRSRHNLFGLVAFFVFAGGAEEDNIEMFGLVSSFYLQKFSMSQEYEADMLGIRYMGKAGYDTNSAVTMFKKMRNYSMFVSEVLGRPVDEVDEYQFISSHPRTIDRIEQAKEELERIDPEAKGAILNEEEYLTQLQELFYVEKPEEGMPYRNRYINTKVGVMFELPQGFFWHPDKPYITALRIENEEITDDIAVFKFDKIYKSPRTEKYIDIKNAHNFLFEIAPPTGSGYVWIKPDLNIPGCSSAAAIERFSFGWLNKMSFMKIVIIPEGSRKAVMIRYLVSREDISINDEKIQQLLKSVRIMTNEEKKRYKPLRVKKHRVVQGDTVASLSRDFQFATDSLNRKYFRVINGMEYDAEVKPGQLVKTTSWG